MVDPVLQAKIRRSAEAQKARDVAMSALAQMSDAAWAIDGWFDAHGVLTVTDVLASWLSTTGVDQEALAAAAWLRGSTVSRHARGEAAPTVPVAWRLAEAMDLHPVALSAAAVWEIAARATATGPFKGRGPVDRSKAGRQAAAETLTRFEGLAQVVDSHSLAWDTISQEGVDVGAALGSWLIETGTSQRQLCAVAGLHSSMASRVVRSAGKPTISSLCQFSKAMDGVADMTLPLIAIFEIAADLNAGKQQSTVTAEPGAQP